MANSNNGDWKEYKSHKVVKAAVITGKSPNKFDGIPELYVGQGVIFEPTVREMANKCEIGDYAMQYRDGYKSVCPKKEFEDGYSEIDNGLEHHSV